MVPRVQRSYVPVQEERARILYVGETAAHLPVSADVVHAPTFADATKQLRQQRFGVLVVELSAALGEDVRKLTRVDPEMYFLVAAREPELPQVGPLAREWRA